MSEEFRYLAEKLLVAEFQQDPFPHLLVEDYLSPEHFDLITSDPQIRLPAHRSSESLIADLMDRDYEVQHFPGCFDHVPDYLRYISDGTLPEQTRPVGGAGLALRLERFANPRIRALMQYLKGDDFKSAIESKFGIARSTTMLTTIQKYLTGYEISPHPDIRAKCMTYLININTDESAAKQPIHTHLLRLKSRYEPIYGFWEQHTDVQRCWVPWDWCESVRQINANNSLLMFMVGDRSLHGIRLNYDHTSFQRTQIYGNLNYHQFERRIRKLEHEELARTLSL